MHLRKIIVLIGLVGLVAYYLHTGRQSRIGADGVGPAQPARFEQAPTPGRRDAPLPDREAVIAQEASPVHEPEQQDPHSEDEEERAYFGLAAAQRLSPWARQTATAVLAVLPPEFCARYPDECASMRARPEAELGELFGPPPGPDELRGYFEDPEVAAPWRETQKLTASADKLRGYGSREAEYLSGQGPPITILDHMGKDIDLLAARVERPEELLRTVQQYGQAIIDSWTGFPSVEEQDVIEERFFAFLWEERCKQENLMIGRMESRDAFWWHLSRVMVRHAYDDSFWIPPDEACAWTLDYPYYLEDSQ